MSSLWQDEQAHSGSSWRTCVVCLPPTKVMPSGKSSMRWLTEGSMLDGHVYEPTNLWVPATVGTDGSVLPTPTAQLAKHGVTPDVHRNSKMGSNLWDIPHLLPTPVVNDMGAGKTLEWWDAWAPNQKAADGRHAPHGKSLSIEVQRLLPTPTARDYKDTGKNTNYQRQADRKLLAGVIMVQQSNDGDTSSDGQPPPQ